ncbi:MULTISPECIES: VOC family protein [Metabacillus]|uniref:Glyoxalase n=2 Tax=Metabacillus TaxID=2675233 RepID=A0A179SP14_9BACI|nr:MULTISPECIES: VOC family protein [Metabacillus]OAS82072.1 glyoxalase [Metabacillus litoralis]QNF29739.1 VOC family protein [Metabacillus sp. KUDC1714]
MSFHGQPNTFVSEVHLKISNLTKSVQFYTDIIGLQILSRSEKLASLTADGVNTLVVLEEIDNAIANTGRNTGLYHIALLLPNRPQLANTLYHLLETRYPLQGASDHLVSEAIYLADPDGNGIEIYADRPEETWKKYDGTIEMATNPLNAEDLLAQRDTESFVSLPPETIMGHIHLQVSSIKESEEFYQALGFYAVNRYGLQALFISTGGYHHHIGLNTWNSAGASAPSENEVGLKTFTVKFPNEEARNLAINNLKTSGAEIRQKENQISTFDPSKNLILLAI